MRVIDVYGGSRKAAGAPNCQQVEVTLCGQLVAGNCVLFLRFCALGSVVCAAGCGKAGDFVSLHAAGTSACVNLCCAAHLMCGCWQSAVITALDAWSVLGSNTKQRVSKVNTTWGTSRMKWHLGRYGCADILLQQAPCCSEGARWVGACRDAKLIQGIVLVPVCARVNRWHPCQRGVKGQPASVAGHCSVCDGCRMWLVAAFWQLVDA